MFKTMLPLGLLLVFALYGYSQNNTTVTAKQTKTTQTVASSGKVVNNNTAGMCDNKRNCVKGNENHGCCGQSNCCGSGTSKCSASCKSNANCNGCKNHQSCGNQNSTPAKTTAPKK